MKTRWKLAAGAVLAMGVLHLPFFGMHCPLGHGTAAQVDRAHDLGAAALREQSAQAAPARPALGLVLDAPFDVTAWARAHGTTCAPIGGNPTLQRCTDVALPDGPVDEITFELRATGELVNVQTLRRGLAADRAAALATTLEAHAAATLGAPSKVGGAATPDHFAHGALATYVAEHAFHDYRATISATSFGPRGTMVREQYLSTL